MRKFLGIAAISLASASNVWADCLSENALPLKANGVVDQGIIDSALSASSTVSMCANSEYKISGRIAIAKGKTLIIEAGATIYGDDSEDFLVIAQGAKIDAVGKPGQLITFTTDIANPAPGSWGGLALNGYAPSNKGNCGSLPAYQEGSTPLSCELIGEGGTGSYGGNNPKDSSGRMEYVSIQYAGAIITAEDERNALALQGVGSRTVLSHIEVYQAADDGMEFFGGNVNCSSCIVVAANDDAFDWTDGYQGFLQNIYAQAENTDNGIEADNSSDKAKAPISRPVVSNFTFWGNGDAKEGNGLLLRKGTNGEIYNGIVLGPEGSWRADRSDAAKPKTCIDTSDSGPELYVDRDVSVVCVEEATFDLNNAPTANFSFIDSEERFEFFAEESSAGVNPAKICSWTSLNLKLCNR